MFTILNIVVILILEDINVTLREEISMFFNILESIVLFPFTIIGWFFGAMVRTTSRSVTISCADYGITRVTNHYKKYL